MPENISKFNIDNIRVEKILGGGNHESIVVHGIVVVRKSETTVNHVKDAKVAVFNTNIEMQ